MKQSDNIDIDDGEEHTCSDDDHAELRQQYRLDASPAKVWRAISVPALRAHWLPDLELACTEAIDTVPEQEVRYRMRERQPPFLESQVRLQISPAPGGGTILTIIHALSEVSVAANDSSTVMMLAA